MCNVQKVLSKFKCSNNIINSQIYLNNELLVFVMRKYFHLKLHTKKGKNKKLFFCNEALIRVTKDTRNLSLNPKYQFLMLYLILSCIRSRVFTFFSVHSFIYFQTYL